MVSIILTVFFVDRSDLLITTESLSTIKSFFSPTTVSTPSEKNQRESLLLTRQNSTVMSSFSVSCLHLPKVYQNWLDLPE